jgi:hypothetical protein
MADAPSSKRVKMSDEDEDVKQAIDEGSDTEEDELAFDRGEDPQHDEHDEDDDNESVDEVSINFRLFDPQPIDFLSLKRMLLPMLPGWDARFAAGASALADAVIAQPEVGTMVKVDDDVDVWAFMTLLPWGENLTTEFGRVIRQFLESKAPASLAERLAEVLDGKTWLMLSERMVNFPPELAPAIVASLLKDVQWARERSPDSASLQADWIMLLAPCFRDKKTKEGESDRCPASREPPHQARRVLAALRRRVAVRTCNSDV